MSLLVDSMEDRAVLAERQVESLCQALRTSNFMLEALVVQLNSWGHNSAVDVRGQMDRNEKLLNLVGR
jgi:hypothetical protein